jgi:hypothetical protein
MLYVTEFHGAGLIAVSGMPESMLFNDRREKSHPLEGDRDESAAVHHHEYGFLDKMF